MRDVEVHSHRRKCLTLCTVRVRSQTEKKRTHSGISSRRAEKKKKVGAAMKSTKPKAQGRKAKAANLELRRQAPLPKKGRGRPNSFIL
jgi:hypothetical protein